MSRQYHPQGRYGHVAVGYRDKVFVWGGRTKKYSDSDKSKLASTVDTFDLRTERWERIDTNGTPPLGLIHCAWASEGPLVYVYGGGDGETDYDTLHRLNLDALTWTKMEGSGSAGPGPGRKNGARMVLWRKKLVLFGGYGDLPQTLPPPAIDDVPSRGLNNDLHIYSISEDDKGTWSFQPSQCAPPPCSHFSFVDIGAGRIAKYGGKEHSGRTDVLYTLSLNSWTWSRVSGLFASPGCKAAHTISYLWGEQPSLLVAGGLGNGDQVSDEAWIFNLGTYTWTKAAKSEQLKRYWHSSTSFPISSSHVRVVLFGGIPKLLRNGETFNKSSNIQNTIVADLRLSQSKPDSPAEWVSVFESNLSTKERLLSNKKLFDSLPMSTDAALDVMREEDLSINGTHLSAGSEMDRNTTLGDAKCTADTAISIGASILPKQKGDQNMDTTMMLNVRTAEDIKIKEDVKTKVAVLSPPKRAISETECRVVEAEKKAEAADKRAVEAEMRAARAESKAADVEKWSCVLQAAMDSAMDRVKYWEERALRAERMLAKASLSIRGQRPASLEVAKLEPESGGQDGDQVPNEVGVMEERTNGMTSASGLHDSGSAIAHIARSVVKSGSNSVEQANATERHSIHCNGIEGSQKDVTGTVIADEEDMRNGAAATSGQPNAGEERGDGAHKEVRSDSPQARCATPCALQSPEVTKL